MHIISNDYGVKCVNFKRQNLVCCFCEIQPWSLMTPSCPSQSWAYGTGCWGCTCNFVHRTEKNEKLWNCYWGINYNLLSFLNGFYYLIRFGPNLFKIRTYSKNSNISLKPNLLYSFMKLKNRNTLATSWSNSYLDAGEDVSVSVHAV
jgi:hypothetical protein